MTNEINTGRTSVKNPRTLDVTNSVAPVGIPYVTSLTKDYSCVVTISGRERTSASTIVFTTMTVI
jgi:hypothetical protein